MNLPIEVQSWIYEHRTTVSAAGASAVATVLGFPLDSIKSRLQVSKDRGILDCVKRTYRHEGLQGFFRGLSMPLVTITAVRTISFSIYDGTKKRLAEPGAQIFDPTRLAGKAALGAAGGATSGLLLSTGTCAFELVKVRSQLEYLIAKRKGLPYVPHGTISGAALIYRENGLRGLYFGYSLHTLRDAVGTSLYFCMYDSLRFLFEQPQNRNILPPALVPFLCGSTCGILSWAVVYPLDAIKTRVQRDALSGVKDRESAWSLFRRLQQKGISRLYRGLGVSALRSAITHGAMWLMLENFKGRIEQAYGPQAVAFQDVKLDYLRSYVSSAAQAVLSKGNSVPGLPGFTLGERRTDFEGSSIWSLHDGTKRDDSSQISIFVFDASPQATSIGRDRRSLLPLAKNALRKLRTLRHPDILRFIDGHETDTAVYIITEPVEPLTARIGPEGERPGSGEEWKVWGLSRIANALKFINASGASTHGNLRPSSIFLSPSGEWRLGGFEVLSTVKDSSPVLYASGGLLPDASRFASPETRKTGYDALKDLDPSALDAYQLYLLVYILFNGPLPSSFASEVAPSLPNARGGIPGAIFALHRRLGNPNPRMRLKVEAFYDLGASGDPASMQQGGGFFKNNRLVQLAEGLENFALASEGDRAVLIKTVKDATNSLPTEFVQYKVLPALIKAFEFGPGGPALLPLVLSLGASLPQAEYTTAIVQPLIRMFASPDRAMRMALLEGLPTYAEKLDQKTVSEKIWPNLITGFNDVVPVIREATVKSILVIAPKLTDRLLNNDLLRYLAKAQTDAEAGIRTNTCILLGRLSKQLQPATSRKVLVPAFARALRDPFVHARIAGLMSLMATVEVFEKDDLAARVIPAMSICLVDKEKTVRLQAFKAIDMFVKRTEQLVASMPETVLPAEDQQTQTSGTAVASQRGQPGIAESAGGAAVALAGWAFTSLSSRLGSADMSTPLAQRTSISQPASGTATPEIRVATNGQATPLQSNGLSASRSSVSSAPSASSTPQAKPSVSTFGAMSGAFNSFSLDNGGNGDWGGDLMDVEADDGDFDDFESAQPADPAPPTVHPRFTVTKARPAASPAGKAGGSMRLGGRTSGQVSTSSDLLKQVAAEEAGSTDWSFDAGNDNAGWETPASPRKLSSPTISNGDASGQSTQTSGNAGKDKLAQMRADRLARLAAAKEKKGSLGAKKI